MSATDHAIELKAVVEEYERLHGPVPGAEAAYRRTVRDQLRIAAAFSTGRFTVLALCKLTRTDLLTIARSGDPGSAVSSPSSRPTGISRRR